MMVLTEYQLVVLLKRLINMTESGDLPWTEAGNDNFKFSANSGSFVFEISSEDKDDNHPYLFLIYNADTLVQSVSSQIGREGQLIPSDINEALPQLYDRAKRRALNMDTVVESLFKDLGFDAAPPPEEPPEDVPF